MIDDSIKLAKFWAELKSLKDQLDNEIIPVGNYLRVDDPDLLISLEATSATIQNYFEQFKLVAEIRR